MTAKGTAAATGWAITIAAARPNTLLIDGRRPKANERPRSHARLALAPARVPEEQAKTTPVSKTNSTRHSAVRSSTGTSAPAGRAKLNSPPDGIHLWHPSRQHTARLVHTVLAAVHKLTRVHALRSDERLGLRLELVRVTELDLSAQQSTSEHLAVSARCPARPQPGRAASPLRTLASGAPRPAS